MYDAWVGRALPGYSFSSESVSEGHPDKVADQVSDAILDAMLRADPFSRVACETFVTAHRITLGGEITCDGFEDVDIPAIVERTVRRIGFDSGADGMWDGAHIAPDVDIVPQSPDIAQGTSQRTDARVGAGDQGMMFGYARRNAVEQGGAAASGRLARHDAPTDDPFDFMPVPISLAHALARRLAEVRRDGTLPYLRPDGKSQVTVRFAPDGTPQSVDALVLAAQHDPDIDQQTLQSDLREHVVHAIIPDGWLVDTTFYINHTGKFVRGGPAADTGLTGRKIIVDTYGGWIPHGGGAFSGKDCVKVDRSAAYYARYAAKNLVAAGVADRLQIQVAYSIGSLEPVSYHVEDFGTAKIPRKQIETLLRTEFDFSPGAIIQQLGLRQPIFEPTAAYGHFGRNDVQLPWEAMDRIEAIVEKTGTLA